MRRIALGGIVGAAVWLGAALTADAQMINQPSGPLSVKATDTSSTYTSTVTTTGNFTLRLRVYKNGVIKWDTSEGVYTSGPTYNYSKLVTGMGSWGLQAGNVLKFRGRATLNATGQYDEKDWDVTVTSGTSLSRGDGVMSPGSPALEAVDRDREEWA